MRRLRILIVCEFSGVVREAFRALGHDAYSCDLLPAADGSPYHIQGDALAVLAGKAGGMAGKTWDLIIMHPPCTYLCGSGLHWNNRGRGWEETEKALAFVAALVAAAGSTPYALENSVGILGARWRKADQSVQPYEFGDDASKRTCLWLSGLPPLVADPALRFAGRWVEWPRGSGKMVERWSNQTDSGQNALAPSPDRWRARSVTYGGIASAMAVQWSARLSGCDLPLFYSSGALQ